jgi:tRNA uridine 5-carboxymethylaminomethyl modification enzyme
MNLNYDIIVVGAGHAGCEAAYASAAMGARVLLVTMDMTKIAQMSCNPAMGGIAKGQIVREIDALGGCSGVVTDRSMIQFRMLNRSKGPAVWSPRAQCDRVLFSLAWRDLIEANLNIDIWQDNVNELLFSGSKVIGIRTRMNVIFHAYAVILTVGTFGNGLIHIGRSKMKGGRISENISQGITEQLLEKGIVSGRLKTGTPARLDGRTIDFSVLEEQKGDATPRRFSFLNTKLPQKQLSCYVTYTNEAVHDILKEGFKDSPLYQGIIQGIGPRYCPSIEDKIVTFSQKTQHQLFLEPEGWTTVEYYLNGFSSSLPLDIQFKAMRKIKGLENVKLFRPGYAIEYDYFIPTQLMSSLESKVIDSLFFAGQINGTTGYEEAAAQGIIAGINAFHKINKREPLVLKREEAYIGVLIDDLVTKGVDEPYRMFTSRAEYRVLLRQDNADIRLGQKAIDIGLATKERAQLYSEKMDLRSRIIDFLRMTSVVPEKLNPFLEKFHSAPVKQKVKLVDILARPGISLVDLLGVIKDMWDWNTELFYWSDLLESIEMEIKYRGYIDREHVFAEKVGRLNMIKIDHSMNFDEISSISTEGRQKLKKYKPLTIGQASRISGISPSDINVLLLFMGR